MTCPGSSPEVGPIDNIDLALQITAGDRDHVADLERSFGHDRLLTGSGAVNDISRPGRLAFAATVPMPTPGETDVTRGEND